MSHHHSEVQTPTDLLPIDGVAKPRADFNRLIDLTKAINVAAGNKAAGGWDDIDHQSIIVLEEILETFLKGILMRDPTELRDGIGDIFFTVIGMGHRAGIDLIGDYDQVVSSNLAKFDRTVHDAELTRLKYRKLGVDTHYVVKHVQLDPASDELTEFYVTRSSEDVKGSDGKQYRKNKWVKSHTWFEPVYGYDAVEDRHLLEGRERSAQNYTQVFTKLLGTILEEFKPFEPENFVHDFGLAAK